MQRGVWMIGEGKVRRIRNHVSSQGSAQRGNCRVSKPSRDVRREQSKAFHQGSAGVTRTINVAKSGLSITSSFKPFEWVQIQYRALGTVQHSDLSHTVLV